MVSFLLWFAITLFVGFFSQEAELLDSHNHPSPHSDDFGPHDHSNWSPVVAKRQQCPKSHEIVFHYGHHIDHYSRVVMINETKVQNSEACAKICFEYHCDVSFLPLTI